MQVETMDRTIPAPPDFPVEWEKPEDANGFWERELQHVPKQATVLEYDLQTRLIENGFNVAFEAQELPVRNAYRRFNTYVYQSIAPISHDPVVIEELGRRAQARMGETLGRLLETWETEFLPEIKESIAHWESFDLPGTSDSGLVAHLDETIRRFERAWDIHFRAVFPGLMGMSLFDDFYREVFGVPDAYAAVRLFQGLDNLSLEADRELYRLSRKAAASPAVLAALARSTPEEGIAELEGTSDGRAFLAELGEYLERYGKRHDGYISWSEPSWIENPLPVLTNLRDYLGRSDRDPDAELAALAAERERLVGEARRLLEERPPEVRGQFEFLLEAGQGGTILQENHNFWIDGRVNHEVRQVLLESGRRLAEHGAVGVRDDVFHLTLDEVREALGGAAALDLKERVAERKDELARWAGVQAPPVLGTFPPGPPPDDPVARAIFKMFGGMPKEPVQANEITGMPGSPGVARGTARVIGSLSEAHRLEAGDVLVTGTTSPPWTPLFATVAAVVTDTGGILSHAAVVAREYMIPAVLGTKRATAAIRDGQLVEVDGDEGVVRVLGEA